MEPKIGDLVTCPHGYILGDLNEGLISAPPGKVIYVYTKEISQEHYKTCRYRIKTDLKYPYSFDPNELIIVRVEWGKAIWYHFWHELELLSISDEYV